jgi:hypothetical protein
MPAGDGEELPGVTMPGFAQAFDPRKQHAKRLKEMKFLFIGQTLLS